MATKKDKDTWGIVGVIVFVLIMIAVILIGSRETRSEEEICSDRALSAIVEGYTEDAYCTTFTGTDGKTHYRINADNGYIYINDARPEKTIEDDTTKKTGKRATVEEIRPFIGQTLGDFCKSEYSDYDNVYPYSYLYLEDSYDPETAYVLFDAQPCSVVESFHVTKDVIFEVAQSEDGGGKNVRIYASESEKMDEAKKFYYERWEGRH